MPIDYLEFRTDERHEGQLAGIFFLMGAAFAAACAYSAADWSKPLEILGFFTVLAGGYYIYARHTVFGRRHVISLDGISIFYGDRLVRQLLWRDVAHIEHLQLRVVTRDRRHITISIPRTSPESRVSTEPHV